MTGFIKIIDFNGSKVYVNPSHVVSVRPEDHESFKDSGAVIKVNEGGSTTDYFIDAGDETRDVLSQLGIIEG